MLLKAVILQSEPLQQYQDVITPHNWAG